MWLLIIWQISFKKTCKDGIHLKISPGHSLGILQKTRPDDNTVQCRYNMVNFLPNPHNRQTHYSSSMRAIWGVFSEFEVRFTFYLCHCSAVYSIITNCIAFITAPNYIQYNTRRCLRSLHRQLLSSHDIQLSSPPRWIGDNFMVNWRSDINSKPYDFKQFCLLQVKKPYLCSLKELAL